MHIPAHFSCLCPNSSISCNMCCTCVCCSVLQCVAVCWSVLQCVAVCCSMLQCVVILQLRAQHVLRLCNVMDANVSVYCSCCSVLQCVAVCCSMLQHVAVCCSVLQCELTDANTACYTYKQVISHVWIQRAKQWSALHHMREWDMSHTQKHHVTHNERFMSPLCDNTQAACDTHERFMSPLCDNTQAACDTHERFTWNTWKIHDTQADTACHTYERIMSHTWKWYFTVWCSVLQCVAVCCSVQCVAVWIAGSCHTREYDT